MPRRAAAESEATAARVLQVAREHLTDRGFAGTTLEEVAADAGVTRGAVYHHYPGKRRLFEAVLAGVQQEVADRVSASTVGQDGGDGWAALEVGCRTFLEVATSPTTSRILLVEAPAVVGWDVWRAADEQGSGRLLREGLQELADHGLLATPVAATTALLSGAMNEAALWIARADDPATAGDEAWSSFEPLLRALRVQPV